MFNGLIENQTRENDDSYVHSKICPMVGYLFTQNDPQTETITKTDRQILHKYCTTELENCLSI